MKRFYFIITIICSLALLQSCHKEEEKYGLSVLVYFAGNNNLSSNVDPAIEQIMDGYLPSGKKGSNVVMVYRHVRNEVPTLTRYYRDNSGETVSEPVATYDASIQSHDISTFLRVIADAQDRCPAKEHGLIVWSHGSNWMPVGYYNSPADPTTVNDEYRTDSAYDGPLMPEAPVKSLIYDELSGDKEMDFIEFTSALPMKYRFVLFDCCLMGSAEVAYELRGKCDYIVASQTEIMSSGFQYDNIFERIFNSTDIVSALTGVCRDYYDYYASGTNPYPYATISLVDCSALNRLAAATSTITNRYKSKIPGLNRAAVQRYDRYYRYMFFFDLEDFIAHLGPETGEKEAFDRALTDAVLFKAATESFLSIKINKFSGLSCYIPSAAYGYLNDYYNTLQWNAAVGIVPIVK